MAFFQLQETRLLIEIPESPELTHPGSIPTSMWRISMKPSTIMRPVAWCLRTFHTILPT